MDDSTSKRWRRRLVALGFMATLAVVGCKDKKNVTTPPEGTGETAGASETGAPLDVPVEESQPGEVVGGELPEQVHKDMSGALAGVYGEAKLAKSTEEKGDVEEVYNLEYALGRAHKDSDKAALVAALGSAGYEVDTEAPTDEMGLFVSNDALADVEIIVSVNDGSETLTVSISKTR
ncbi:MAG: hypothetical protein R3A51_19090 [Nannocystaceae bacterium]